MSRRKAGSPVAAADIELIATSMLQVILNDALRTMRNEEYSPDARMLAQRQVMNLVEWDAGTGTLIYSTRDVLDARDKIRVTGTGTS